MTARKPKASPQPLKAGKAEADNRVERSLYQRAVGYHYDGGMYVIEDVQTAFWANFGGSMSAKEGNRTWKLTTTIKLDHPLPERPRRMHRTTYERLRRRLERLEQPLRQNTYRQLGCWATSQYERAFF